MTEPSIPEACLNLVLTTLTLPVKPLMILHVLSHQNGRWQVLSVGPILSNAHCQELYAWMNQHLYM